MEGGGGGGGGGLQKADQLEAFKLQWSIHSALSYLLDPVPFPDLPSAPKSEAVKDRLNDRQPPVLDPSSLT